MNESDNGDEDEDEDFEGEEELSCIAYFWQGRDVSKVVRMYILHHFHEKLTLSCIDDLAPVSVRRKPASYRGSSSPKIQM